jgi:capsular polysaccharide transport system permease protein
MTAAANEGTPPLTEVALLNSAEVQQPVVGSAKAQAQALRKERSRRLLRRMGVYVVLPTALAIAYFGAIASAQYESYSLFSIQSSESRPVGPMDGLLAGISGGGGRSDALTVRDYVLSRDMLARLDKEHGFIKHYQDPAQDWYSRLSAQATFEKAYEYFGGKVFADYDQASGTVTVHVRSFSPEKSQLFARSILAYSEEMVNKLSDRERHDRIAHAEDDVKNAEARLLKARKSVIALQQEHADFSPQETAHSAMEIRAKLEAELAKARAELMQRKAFMRDDAPQVLAAQEVVKALSAQVSNESRRLVDPGKGAGLGNSMADFEGAMVEKEFSQKFYQSAMTNLELARADAARQHRYLAVIANPSRPDSSTYPHRARSILTAFVLSFLLLGVGSLFTAAVREHARL